MRLAETFINGRGIYLGDYGYKLCDVNSYIPVKEYKRKHIAPLMQVLRRGEGIAVPSKYITISEIQPLADNY